MKLTQQEFTYSEFLRYVENTPRVSSRHTGGVETDSENTDDPDWYQTRDWNEAIDFARNGWQAGIDAISPEADLAVGGSTEVQHAISGAVVDVGAYLSGAPECMVQFVDMEERDREELVVYAQLGYNAYVSGTDAMEFSKKLLGHLMELNREYSLKLVGVFCADQEDIRGTEFITIKDTYQNLVLNNVAFSYHPSFFRRLWFRYLETKDYRDRGYGRTVSGEVFRKTCGEYHGRTNPRAKHLTVANVAELGLDWEIENLKIVKK